MKKKVKIKKWTADEVYFLKMNALRYTKRELGDFLNRSLGSIDKKICTLGLHTGGSKRKPWTDKEVEYLKENYHSKTIKEICKELHRGHNSINWKVQMLGLTSSDDRKFPNLGRKIESGGYVLIYCPNCPNSRSNGYVSEHRYYVKIFRKTIRKR